MINRETIVFVYFESMKSKLSLIRLAQIVKLQIRLAVVINNTKTHFRLVGCVL